MTDPDALTFEKIEMLREIWEFEHQAKILLTFPKRAFLQGRNLLETTIWEALEDYFLSDEKIVAVDLDDATDNRIIKMDVEQKQELQGILQGIDQKWGQILKEHQNSFAQEEVWQTSGIVTLPDGRLSMEKIQLLKRIYESEAPEKDVIAIQQMVKDLEFFQKLPKGVIG